jgi:hypothetical protein
MDYSRPGQTFDDQELLLIFPESRGPPHILMFLVVYGKAQDIYNNNNNKGETESVIMAAQDQAISTHYFKNKILKQEN